MSTTMMVLGSILILNVGFVLGAAFIAFSRKTKATENAYTVSKVVSSLRLKLVTENDHRGFHTRTQVSDWLSRTGKELEQDLKEGSTHGRKAF